MENVNHPKHYNSLQQRHSLHGLPSFEEAQSAREQLMAEIWHDVSEEPDIRKHVVVCTNGRTIWTAMAYDLMGASHWAYVEDLVPNIVKTNEL
jgi:hypothetical protein